MNARSSIVVAVDDADLSMALGCSHETLQTLRDDGVLESQGQLWEVGPAAHDYLRDAAWADSLWR